MTRCLDYDFAVISVTITALLSSYNCNNKNIEILLRILQKEIQ